MNDELKEYLLININGSKLVSGGREILTRCPNCGDSQDKTKAHLYIGLGSEDTPPMYNCFKCRYRGIVDSSFMMKLNLYDADVLSSLNKTYKNKIRSNKNTNKYYMRNKFIRNSNISYNKLKYINDRLGTSLSLTNMEELKIVLNIEDLLDQNNITDITREEYVINDLNKNYIGFMTMNNDRLIMRNYNESSKMRYINYNIFGNESSRFYVIPTNIDISQYVKVYITEGIFDILSLYLNVIEDKYNTIFVAVGGKGYSEFIKYILEETNIINVEFNIMIDSDVENYIINSIYNKYSKFSIDNNIGPRFKVYKNVYPGMKDYGVTKDKIQVQQIRGE